MQVNRINSYQQNFQGIHFNDGVINSMKQRVKASELETLQGYITEIKSNKLVNANIYLQEGGESTKLGANIYPTSSNTGIKNEYTNEGLFYRFKSPVTFFKSVCGKVNKMASKVNNEIHKNEVIDNIVK